MIRVARLIAVGLTAAVGLARHGNHDALPVLVSIGKIVIPLLV